MPLVIPGITPQGGDHKTNEWTTMLMGKKLTDSTSDHSSFAKKDLPEHHRILEGENAAMTMDYRPDRLNVHLDNDGLVKSVFYG